MKKKKKKTNDLNYEKKKKNAYMISNSFKQLDLLIYSGQNGNK